mmetsp:Transcript_38664/g.70891  ORF Transcript_38664/g.70891 Transcript_38664/m.70891 type:complete len:187 (-) Transcript_38664:51-611(-)
MRAMINLGFAPTSERSLQRVMKEKDAGQEITDDEWSMKVVSGCIGIQSKLLDDRAEDHLKYCYDKGWYMSAYRQWHAKDCSLEGLDKSGRCSKCRNVYKNLSRMRHPTLFESPVPLPSPLSIIPSDERIGSLVSERLTSIGKTDITTDSVLKECARLLRVNDCDGIEYQREKEKGDGQWIKKCKII